jgi:hypothetical protein
MTKYEEMCDAAKTARDEFEAYRKRCGVYFWGLIGALQSHCGVPPEKFTFLKWNGEREEARQYLAAEPGMKYTLPGAIDYDELDGFWNLGVLTTLTPDNVFPKQWVTFVLCIKEQNQSPIVKIGLDGKTQVVDLSNVDARNQYCEILSEKIIEAFKGDPTKPAVKTIGFVLGTERPDSGVALSQALVQETNP